MAKKKKSTPAGCDPDKGGLPGCGYKKGGQVTSGKKRAKIDRELKSIDKKAKALDKSEKYFAERGNKAGVSESKAYKYFNEAKRKEVDKSYGPGYKKGGKVKKPKKKK